jgi:hypothetical protein
MKKKTILGMLIVMTVSSTAMADYFADFDGWVTADLDVAPWSRTGGATVIGDTPNLGLNPTDRVQIGGGPSGAWLRPVEADQFAQGTLEFDLLMNGIAPGWPGLNLILSDDDLPVQGVWFRIQSETGAGSDDLDLFVFDPGVASGSVALTDFMTRDAWYNFKIDFDAVGQTYDVSVDDVLLIDDEPTWGAFGEVNRITWQNPVGFYTQIDNVSLIPEPGSLALLGIGALLLNGFRKRRIG